MPAAQPGEAVLSAAQLRDTQGCVTAVRGAVLDISFAAGALPLIDEALEILSGEALPLIAEVQAHLDETTVRALALRSTNGLARGTGVRATGGKPRFLPPASRSSTCSPRWRKAARPPCSAAPAWARRCW
jgi:hypothetical protein